MAEIQWEDPPDVETRRMKHRAFYEALRANPGRWARFPGAGAPNHLKAKGYEIRRVGNGQTDRAEAKVWVRFVGTVGQPEMNGGSYG